MRRIFLSFPFSSRRRFCRWRIMTTTGIATAAVRRGQRFEKYQFGFSAIAAARAGGKTAAAAMEASETYRQIMTQAIQTANASAAAVV